MSLMIPVRLRRQTAAVLLVFAVLTYITWTRSYANFSSQNHENHTHPPSSSTLKTPEHLPAEYGTTARPPFKDVIHNSDLPAKFLPKLSNDASSDVHQGRRLIFVGDVHGMLTPLKELLSKINFDAAAGDHVIFTGDLIMKGPDSVGVVEYAMDIGASAVRGNHEDRVLLAAQKLDLERRRRKHHQKAKPKAEDESEENESSPAGSDDAADVDLNADSDYQETLTDSMEEEHFSRGDSKNRALARRLTTHQLTWLASLPVILKVGHLPPMGDVVAVHAGLVPGIPLEKQDPWACMNMRTLLYLGEDVRVEFARIAIENARRSLEPDDEKKERINVGPEDTEVQDLAMRDKKDWDNDVFVPVASREGKRWAKVWDKEMKTVSKNTEATVASSKKEGLVSVIFGHDSKNGLQLGKYSFGIDSGCVRGGQLTAFVIEASSSGKHVKTRLESVECKSPGRVAKDEDDF